MIKPVRLIVSISLLIAAAACGEDSSATGTGGAAGVGGAAGMGGVAGDAGMAGMGGEGGIGGQTVPKGNCHSSVPDLLSEWGLFADIRNQVPSEGVIPYEVTSPLFTDGALKHRFVTLTKGGAIEYANDSSRWKSPVGTIYVKTFAFPPDFEDPETDGLEQLVETRLLVHVAASDDRLGCSGADSCWQVHVYVYDESMSDAVCQSGGETVSVTYTDPLDETQKSVENYAVPSNGSCRDCHGADETKTIGPSTGMLNRGNAYGGVTVANQIDQLYELNMLAPEPPPEGVRTTYVDPIASTTACQTPACLHEAARSFFASNCSHCHAPDGEAKKTALYLDYASMDPANPTAEDFATWGVCRTPTSAGGVRNCGDADVDILPGDPDNSILLCRMNSVTPSEMMAPVGRTLIDEDASELIRQWILNLPVLFPDIATTCSN